MAWFSDAVRRLGSALSGPPPGQNDAPRSAPPGRGPVTTDAGMFALWDPEPFRGITDYDTWERELLEHADIERHVQAAHLVPINIFSDGAFEFEVRVGSADAPAVLAERERRYLTVSSEPYLVRASGGVLRLSGLERVGGDAEPAGVLAVPVTAGSYAVTVHMVEWDAEPGMQGPDGRPTPSALPDFVVLVNQPAGPGPFRQSVETFVRPPDEEPGDA